MSCTQQGAVYDAERATPRGREFATPSDVEDFYDDLHDRYARWEYDFPNVLWVEVYSHGGNRPSTARAENQGGVVDLHRDSLCERVALHELAHVLANSRYGEAGHSPWYVRIMLELTYTAAGPDAYAGLKASYDALGVDHRTDDFGSRSICL